MAETKVLSGNYAAAESAAKCSLDLIAAYPITPQSSVVEHLSKLVHDGKIDTNLVQVESEHSAMSIVQGGVVAGGRTFTATSSQGLALMFEPYFRMSTLRLPMVMVIASREMTSPETIWSGHQDAMSVREAGWIQMYCDSNQEIADMIIQAYKITENKKVLIPINICYDGFYSSHLVSSVEILDQEEVNKFLPKFSNEVILNPKKPLALDPMTPGNLLMKYRFDHLQAMQNAKIIIDEVDTEFGDMFGRYYGGLIEEYKNDDSEVVIITMGSMTGAGKDAVDIARQNGIKAGLIKVRFFRPFPSEKIREALVNKKSFSVIDKSVSFGWNSGSIYTEVKASLATNNNQLFYRSVIAGLGGEDISVDDIYNELVYLDSNKYNVGEQDAKWILKNNEE